MSDSFNWSIIRLIFKKCIAHHVEAIPTKNPRKGFDFVNSCQGGENIFLYNISSKWTKETVPAVIPSSSFHLQQLIIYQGTNLYLIHFDGEKLSIKRNYSEITGIGLGVHTCLHPIDAKSFTCSDGQKDVNAWFDIETGRVRAAFRYDWEGNDCSSLKNCWAKGGKVRIVRLKPGDDGKYNLTGTRGNKIDYELVPMAEGDIEEGNVNGTNKEGLTAADGWVWHPSGKWAAEILRMVSSGIEFLIVAETFEARWCGDP